MHSIGDMLSSLRRHLSLPAVSPHVQDRLRAGQLSRLVFLCYVFAATGCNTLLLVIWVCWGENHKAFLIADPLAIACVYGLLVSRAISCRSRPAPEADSRPPVPSLMHEVAHQSESCGFSRRNPDTRGCSTAARQAVREFNVLYVLLGTLWGLLLVGLVPGSDAEQRSLLYSIAVALVSTAALNVPFSVVLAFGIPAATGTLISIAQSNAWSHFPTGGCFVGYALLTLAYAVHSNRSYIERSLYELKLEEQGEVIGLLLREFLDNASDWLWETDASLRLVNVPSRMEQAASVSERGLDGLSLEALIDQDAADGEGISSLKRCLEDRISFRDLVVPIRVAGETRWWSVTGKPSLERGAFLGYRGIGSDVTAARVAEARVAFMAHHDALTGLPNRALLCERVDQALAQIGRDAGFAVLLLDLDRFKIVNDTLGHPAGDELLRAVAERLQACVREVDTVARLGGDEFAVVQCGLERAEDAALLARRIVEAVGKPYDLDGHHVTIGTSVGISVAPGDAMTFGRLLKNADVALYRAKEDGRETWRFFEPDMDARLQARRALELDLRAALAHDEFELYYQPLFDLGRDRVGAFEALLRWHHPIRGVVSPAEFVPVAEEIGLIVPIGEWVLKRACAEASDWPGHVRVAVNVSPAQFKGSNLVECVTGALAAAGLPASRLDLEITESVMLTDSAATLATLHALRALGARISMDDFGTGYSSLSYLHSFPFDKIKIDQTFVRNLVRTEGAEAIVRAIILLGRSLNMRTTAEGVESDEQLVWLRAEGCSEAQGYLFSPPRPAAEIPELLWRWRDGTSAHHRLSSDQSDG